MSKATRIVKGYVPKTISAKDLLFWDEDGTLTEAGVITKHKGRKSDWQDWAWPPRKVTLTVTVEE